ncbi:MULTISPECIES: hypothetical protein [unclassified Acidovorax]|jgi:hypothetical protein|uniref:hypothetical protein n=1 Tax=unclassified Acidovorax TaxID=2684926 RepID=UPI0010F4A83B|nr:MULTISPECIES: hypothetical protein [unclassified Acidovorax]MDA8520993.1 hypothetical protein [Acidovorax sp. NCPPB 4044]
MAEPIGLRHHLLAAAKAVDPVRTPTRQQGKVQLEVGSTVSAAAVDQIEVEINAQGSEALQALRRTCFLRGAQMPHMYSYVAHSSTN